MGSGVAIIREGFLGNRLMNIFKELVLEQKKKKRMGNGIRQRFFLIAGRLVQGSRRFILKLQEDWANQYD